MTDLVKRLRAGTGGGKHWMDLHTEASDEIERLRGWIAAGGANCPCCGASDVCMEGCTFAEDCPEDAEKMLEIRKFLSHNADVSGLPPKKG